MSDFGEVNTHKCPKDGCEEILPFYILMCQKHWRLVPWLLKVEVKNAWRTRRRNWQRYAEARAAAVAAVNREGAKTS